MSYPLRIASSINSVTSHIWSVYRTGVTTRSQAAVWGVRHGLVDLDELMAGTARQQLAG